MSGAQFTRKQKTILPKDPGERSRQRVISLPNFVLWSCEYLRTKASGLTSFWGLSG